MDDAGGLFATRASAAIAAVPPFEAYSRDELAAVLAEAADREADLREAIDEARAATLLPPLPLDVVPRADADLALRAAEDRLAALQAELADAQAQLLEAQQAQQARVDVVPLVIPAAIATPGVLTWPVAPARVAPAPVAPVPVAPAPVAPAAVAPAAEALTVAVPVVVPEVAPLPAAAPAPVLAPQVIVAREPFARATGLLQVVTWSIVVAVVLIVLLAWFA